MLAFLAVLRNALSTMLPIGAGAPAFTLQHPSGVLIHRGIREAEIRGLPGVRSLDMADGRHWYKLEDAEISGRNISMSLYFSNEALEFLSFAIVDGEAGRDPWKNWSEEREQQRLEAIRQWLADVEYAAGDYVWGTVFAEIDVKSGGVMAGVKFR